MTDCADLDTNTDIHIDVTLIAVAQEWPLPVPFDVQVRDVSGGVRTGQVVAADLVLVTGEALRAPVVVDLPDASQVTAIKIIGPEPGSEGEKLWALEFVPGTVPTVERLAASSKPFWCGIFGSRLASCR